MNGEADDPFSPICYAGQGDDIYMGYAGREELVDALNELLEAERAGAHVARATRGSADASLHPLMQKVAADEARWCAMLSTHIKRLSAVPSRKRGAFYEKAMAIADLSARLAFLNRGQAWVERRLRELLPRVRSDMLHADLRAMLESHGDNIASTEAAISALAEPDGKDLG